MPRTKWYTELAEGMKLMTSSITMLVKAINPTSAVTQSNLIGSGVDPQTVQGVVDPQRVNELETSQKGDLRTGEEQLGTNNTYLIEEPTREFLNVAFALKKSVENKVRVSWEERFDMPDCDIIRCPKLDPITESVLKKEAVDEDSQWSRLQNFMQDATCPLVAAFKD